MKKIKVSYIGCGRIFQKHLNAVKNNKRYFEIDAICDVDLKKTKFYKNSNIKTFKNIDDLLKRTNSDLYVILTPSGYHFDHIVKVGKQKKNILVEKPMVMNFSQCKKLNIFLKKCKVNLYVVKQNRFNSAILKLKEAIDNKRFGKIFLATIRVRWNRGDKYFNLDKWRGTWKYDGGVLANQASHHIDLLSWLVGDIETVYAKASKINKTTKVFDTVAALLKFKNGATGILETTTATEPENLEGSISILGEKGTVEIGGFAVSKVINWKFKKKIKTDSDITKYSISDKNIYGSGHVKLYKEIFKSLLKKKNNSIKFVESVKTVRLIDKLYASIEANKEININDNNFSKLLGK